MLFISVGTCPYRERCVYLHDARCLCKSAKSKSRKKNRDDTTTDALFWPFVSTFDTQHQHQRIIAQSTYQVPRPSLSKDKATQSHHDEAMYSLWNTFVEFCVALNNNSSSQQSSNNNSSNQQASNNNSSSQQSSPVSSPDKSHPIYCNNVNINKFTGRRRLKVFFDLANSEQFCDTPTVSDPSFHELNQASYDVKKFFIRATDNEAKTCTGAVSDHQVIFNASLHSNCSGEDINNSGYDTLGNAIPVRCEGDNSLLQLSPSSQQTKDESFTTSMYSTIDSFTSMHSTIDDDISSVPISKKRDSNNRAFSPQTVTKTDEANSH